MDSRSGQTRPAFSLFNIFSSIRGAVAHPSASPGASANVSSAARALTTSSSANTNAPGLSISSSVAAAAASRNATASNATSAAANMAPTTASVTRSTTTSITIPIPRRRGSHGSESSTGGFVDRPGPPLYIGGKLDSGEVKFYKLGVMRARMSDTSLDRMSL